MILVIIFVLLFLFFCFLTWQFTKTWRPTHVVFAFLTFTMAMLFCIVAAANLKNQLTWRKMVHDLEQSADRLQSEKQILSQGDLTAVRQEEPNLRMVKAELGRLLLDRGRVWRTLAPSGIANNAITLATVPTAPDAPAEPLAIEPGTIVYAFSEGETPDGYKVPAAYLGEFEVAATQDNTVTIRPTPTAQIDNQQMQLIRQGNATWVLYEMMPIDTHQVLSGATQEQLRALMPQPDGVPPEDYERLIQSYVRDLQRARDDDPPENRWIKVRFIKVVPDDYAVVTGLFKEVDNVADQEPISSDYFDLSGRAIVPRLRRGNLADFAIDKIDYAILNQETAEQLIRDGYVEMVEPVFVRQLNDYALGLQVIGERSRSVAEATARVQRDIQLMQDAIARVERQIGYRQDEQTKLQEDLQKFVQERDAVTEFAAAVQQQLQQTRGQLSTTYRRLHLLETQLDQIHRILVQEVNERVSRAAASNP